MWGNKWTNKDTPNSVSPVNQQVINFNNSLLCGCYKALIPQKQGFKVNQN